MLLGTRIALDYSLDVDTAYPKTFGTRRKMLAFVKKGREPIGRSYSMDHVRGLLTRAGLQGRVEL